LGYVVGGGSALRTNVNWKGKIGRERQALKTEVGELFGRPGGILGKWEESPGEEIPQWRRDKVTEKKKPPNDCLDKRLGRETVFQREEARSIRENLKSVLGESQEKRSVWGKRGKL